MSEKIYVQVGVRGRSLPPGGNPGDILQKVSEKDFETQWTTPAGGASANIPQPWVGVMSQDAGTGSYGGSPAFASGNHYHALNVNDSVLPSDMGDSASSGDDAYYARRDHVHKHDDYPTGFVLNSANIFDSVEDLEDLPHKAGRIAFVKVS